MLIERGDPGRTQLPKRGHGCILIHSSVELSSLRLIDALTLGDFPNVAHRTIPGSLGIIKIEPTFEDALDHALEIQPRLAKHIVLIDRDERSLRHHTRAIPGLDRHQVVPCTLVLALKATDDVSSDLVIAYPFAPLLPFH